MKTKYIYNFLFILMLLCLYKPYFAYSESESNFNPNFLISDEEMQNYQCMNREDIQAFLDDKNGYISNLKIEDKNGEIRQVSDIISRAAQEHKINPKYLLVKLQKEQSLVTDADPTQKQIDWATGYGVCDSCKLDDPDIQKHKGFGTQVDSAAGIIRWYYENITKENWIKKPNITYAIDSTTVIPANYATAFLYTYTPHMLGNQNFWKLWQTWFKQMYPNGTLIKAASDTTVFLIDSGEKRAFSNMAALSSRFNPKMIITVQDSELNNYKIGSSILLPNYAILKNNNDYFLLDNDTLKKFDNAETIKKIGYNPDEIIEVSNADIVGYKIAQNLITATGKNPRGQLVKLKENNAMYLLKDNSYSPIYDEVVAKTNYPNLKFEKISATEIKGYVNAGPMLLKNGTLFGIKGENSIYAVEDGKKRHIVSEKVFEGLGYKWENIAWVNEITGMAHQTGEPLYLQRTVVAKTDSDIKTVIAEAEADEIQITAGKMYTTPVSDTKYIGDKFDTKIDAYLAADYETGEILAGKNIDSARPMASFTKIMTAYVLFKNGIQANGSVTYNEQKHKAKYNQYVIGNGDQVLNKDLLSAMLISSFNTPANMLVSNIDENRANFVAKMNNQAKEWGLSKTKFVDVTGEDLKNVATAKEYLALFSYAIKNADLLSYAGQPSYSYEKLKNVSGKRLAHSDINSNLLMEKTNLKFNIIASKTGYLDEAGAGLAMLIQRKSDQKKFIIITMGNPDYSHRFDDPEKLSNWVISKF
jgi:D-alanyl-D-alanine carboxypeptidase